VEAVFKSGKLTEVIWNTNGCGGCPNCCDQYFTKRIIRSRLPNAQSFQTRVKKLNALRMGTAPDPVRFWNYVIRRAKFYIITPNSMELSIAVICRSRTAVYWLTKRSTLGQRRPIDQPIVFRRCLTMECIVTAWPWRSVGGIQSVNWFFILLLSIGSGRWRAGSAPGSW